MLRAVPFLNFIHIYEVCSINSHSVNVDFRRIRLVSLGSYKSADFSGRRYLHLLISYTVLIKECFFRLSDCKMDTLKEQRIAVKFCVLVILDKKFSSSSERSSSS